MSASNITTNLNMLSPGNFKVTIDSKEYANIQFFCTAASVPSISQSEIQTGYKNNNAYIPGDTIEYGTLDVNFIIDEEMKNYLEIHDWLITNKSTNPKYRDITLSILTNKNTVNKQILFHDAFPTSLGALEFTTQDTGVEYLSTTATFRYNRYEFLR